MKKDRGITLIALIITIIILLILAGVTIAILTGENGILENTKNVQEETIKSNIREEISLAILAIRIDEMSKTGKIDMQTVVDNLPTQIKDITIDLSGKEAVGRYKGYDYYITEQYEVVLEKKEIDYEDYILKHFKADKFIYLSSSVGNDDTGNGTKQAPYKTLDKIADTGIVENNLTYVIVLKEGNYVMTRKMFSMNCNKSINLVGYKQNTVLEVEDLVEDVGNRGGNPTGNGLYEVNLYRLTWLGKPTDKNSIYVNNKLSLNNVLIKVDCNYSDYFLSGNRYLYNNCLFATTSNNDSYPNLRFDTHRLINCYGRIFDNNGANSDWDYQTNYITNEIKVNEEYRITEDSSLWKNIGTGTNPDGTQANIGLYGGEFSWEE